MCPKGVDPLTFYAAYRTIILSTGASAGYLAGTFKFTFNGQHFYFPAAEALWTSAQCQASFDSLVNVGSVKCSKTVKVRTVRTRRGALYSRVGQNRPSLHLL